MMSLASIRAMGLGSALIVLAGALSSGAQEAAVKEGKSNNQPTTSKRASDPSRRVPTYFGQLGLTPEQKESVYKIRAKHYAKITALQKEIADLQATMLAECETVLTDSQKKHLQERRELAAETKQNRKGAGSSEAPAKTAKP